MTKLRVTFREYQEHFLAVFKRTDIGLPAKAVYWLLADHAGEKDYAHPATRTMATALYVDVKTILRAVTELETVGLVKVQRPIGNPARQFNIYTLPKRPIFSSAGGKEALPLSTVERSLCGTGALEQREQNQPNNQPNEPTYKKKHADAITWTVDSGWLGIQEADRTAWTTAYPACDLDAELARMTEWLKSNPSRAHKRGWRRFLNNWLARSQERGGSTPSIRPSYTNTNGNGHHRQPPRANPKTSENITTRIL